MKKKRLVLNLFVLLFAFVILASPSVIQAETTATCTATGAGWAQANSWDCGNVPTASDDVIIPSGWTMRVNASSAVAGSVTVNGTLHMGNNNSPRTLTVSGDVTIGSSGTLDVDTFPTSQTFNIFIGGNLINHGTFDGRAPSGGNGSVFNVTFNGSSSQAISGSNAAAFHGLTVNTGAIVTIPSGATQPTVDGTLTNNGSLVQASNVPSSTTTQFLHIQDSTGSADKYFGVDVTPDSSSMGTTTIIIKGNQTQCNAGDQLIHRCFDIAPTSANSATVRFWYLNSESNSETISSMNIYHWNGSSWDTLTLASTPRDTEGSYEWVEAVNVSSYSPFGLSDGSPGGPTAVTLQSFSAQPDKTALFTIIIIMGLLLSSAFIIRQRKHSQ